MADAVISVRDNRGWLFQPDSLPQTLTYNGDGTLATVVATDGTNTYTQTLTYTSGNLTSVSAWVKS